MTITDLYILLFGKEHIKDGDVISMAEHGRAGGISTGQGFKTVNSVPLAVKVTEVSPNTYIAKSKPGTSQSDPYWQCMKINETSGAVITWADGNDNFDNLATDLTGLDYL